VTARRRLLWLVKGLGRGGAEQLLLDIARHLDTSAFAVHVGYVLPHKDALVPDLEAAGVQVHCLSGSGLPWPLALRRLVTAEVFDVVHTHSPVVAAAARVVVPRGTVLLHTEHNMWDRYRWPSRLANAVTLRRNRQVWAVSDGVARSMLRSPFTRGVDIRVMIHGIDPAAFMSAPAARGAALARLGLTPGPFTVGTVGNLTAKKNHDALVAAVGILRRTVPGARLVLVGGGPREAALRQLVRAADLEGAVLMTGVRDDVPALLPAFDVFAMSSRFEGLSIALLEAMAAGVAPVVTRVGGMPEVIRDGRDGLLVEPDDPGALAEAMVRLAGDDAFRSAVGAAARRRASDFSIVPAVQALTTVYHDACPAREVTAS
jgi:glycosyltransferase involved in cell wall biosynthesis